MCIIHVLLNKYADQVTELDTERVLLTSRIDELGRESSINIEAAQQEPYTDAVDMRATTQQLQSLVHDQELRLKSISHAAFMIISACFSHRILPFSRRQNPENELVQKHVRIQETIPVAQRKHLISFACHENSQFGGLFF